MKTATSAAAREGPRLQAEQSEDAEDPLAALATGRTRSLFAADFAAARAALRDRFRGLRVLVIGGAGSIGGAVVRALSRERLAALHIVDAAENNLVECVRDLRSRPGAIAINDFRTFPVDFGSEAMRRILFDLGPYDVILNFAAVKHVRSEKDIYSLLQMLDTNVAKQARLLRWMKRSGFEGRYFSVSTDKAANPVSLLGATKRLMEHIMFSGSIFDGHEGEVTSARFANVAFSDGSLLAGWMHRLHKRQPVMAPRGTRRYFVSLEESAQICILGALRAPDQAIVIPKLSPEDDLVALSVIAEKTLAHFGLTAAPYADEAAAKRDLADLAARSAWPLLLTEPDTSGEKPYEEFVGAGETVATIGMETLESVGYRPADPDALRALIDAVEGAVVDGAPIEKRAVIEKLQAIIPEFAHIETGRDLDQRL